MRARSLGSVMARVLTGVRCQKVSCLALVVVDGVGGGSDVDAGEVVASDFVEDPGEQGEGVVTEAVVDEVLEVLSPEVAVADLASFGEGVVVVFEAVDVAVVGYSD